MNTKTNRSNIPSATAREEFEEQQAALQQMIAKATLLAADYAKHTSNGGQVQGDIHWGHVGDMTAAANAMAEVLRFLGAK